MQTCDVKVFIGNACWHLPSTDGQVGNGIVVRLEHFGILEDFVAESVDSIEGDSDGDSFHPILSTKCQLVNVVSSAATKYGVLASFAGPRAIRHHALAFLVQYR